jgi:hypothetical protein
MPYTVRYSRFCKDRNFHLLTLAELGEEHTIMSCTVQVLQFILSLHWINILGCRVLYPPEITMKEKKI